MASRDEKLRLLEEDKAKDYGVTVTPPPVVLENSRDKKVRLLEEDRETNPVKQLNQEQIEFKKGGPKNINFSQYDHNLEKLQSYGSKFQKYGFDPRIDNASFYNDQLTSSEQWARSFKGAGELMSVGFTDNMLFEAWASGNSSKDYAKTVDMYSSTKGGSEGFMQNLVLNSGYTVGIIADMVIEEAALAGITALTFGSAAPETGALMMAKAGQGFRNIKNAYNMYSNLNKTIRAVNTTNKLNNLKRVGNFLNPLENTTNFIKSLKNAETLKDVGVSGKVMLGTGALFRDAKAIHLAKTEADLEGNMLNTEVYDDLVANHEGILTMEDADRYKKQANEASWWAKAENMAVIGATNKLVFNNMFKAFDDLKGLGKVVGQTRFFNIVKEGAKDARVVQKGLRGSWGRTKMMFGDGFGTGLKRVGKGITSKGGTYLSANIGEGLQETLQETINIGNKHHYGSEAQGKYWDNMLYGLKEQFTGQGLETFLSGFLMGTVISPVNFSIKQVSSMKGGGYKAFTDPKNYKAGRSTEKNRLESDVRLINELFKDAGDVFKAKGNNLAAQSEMEKEMMDAVMNGDQFEFQNAKNKSYRAHLNAAMKYDMMDQFIEHLDEMKTMDAEQFGEAFPTVGSKTTKAQRDNIIDRKIQKAEEFRENHEWVKTNIINPIQLNRLDKNSPNYEAAKQYHDYFERAKEELVFAKAEIADNIDRKESLLDNLRTELDNNSAGEISFNEYQKLFNAETIDSEIRLLKTEIESLNFSEVTGEEKKLLKSKEAKHEALSRFKESLDEMQEVSAEISELEDIDPNMLTPTDKKELKRLNRQYDQANVRVHNRHDDYLKELAPKTKGVAFTNLSEKSFKALHDYYRLDSKNAGLDFLVNVLTNEKMLDEAVTRRVEMHKAFMAQFKRYVKNSMTMSRNKDVVQKGLNSLYSAGMGFNLKYLDPLTNEGKMPPAFYDLETGEKISEKTTTSTGEEPNVKYVTATTIVEEMYDALHDKPTENLKESSEKEKDVAEEESFEGAEATGVSKDIGGASDRRDVAYVPTEQDDVEITERDTIDSYPPIVINSLIEEYKSQVAGEDLVDKAVEDLTADALSDRFKRWVNDSADAERIIKEHNQRVAPIPNTFEVLSDQEKARMMELGYETEEAVNALSKEEVDNILEAGTKPAEEQEVESSTMDIIVDGVQIITEDGTDTTENEGEVSATSEGEVAVETQEAQGEQVLTISEDATEDEITELATKIVEQNGEQLVLEFEEEIPAITTAGEETFDSILQQRDEGVSYRESRALNLIDFATEQQPGDFNDTDFFNTVVAVEDILLNNLGEEVNGYEITEEVIQDIYKILEKHPNANNNTLEQFSNKLDYKLYDYNNQDILDAKEQGTASRIAKMRDLGYTKKDIDSFSENAITSILNKGTSKNDYVKGLKTTNKTDIKEIQTIFNSLDTNVRTEAELTNMLVEISLNNGELFDRHSETIVSEIEKIRNSLASLKGFSNLKEGDVVQMADGSLKKVSKLLKSKVELVNYNDIIQNKTSLTKAEFNKESKRIVNDFNKGTKNLVSELEKQNVNDLSVLLSNFTGGALMAMEEVPTEEEMRDHFKLCK